ncbi:MAG: hypothetical protein ACMXX7_00720 [Candidatus Woesearchaeota archaeon]
MVKISINDDLSEYLENRKNKEEYDSSFSDFFKNLKTRFSKVKSSKQELTPEESYEDEEEFDELPKKKSLMSRIFRRKPKYEEDEDDFEDDKEDEEELRIDEEKEELKELVKILHKWIEKLPSDKINQFKRSPDFEKYKSGLKKLNMIK